MSQGQSERAGEDDDDDDDDGGGGGDDEEEAVGMKSGCALPPGAPNPNETMLTRVCVLSWNIVKGYGVIWHGLSRIGFLGAHLFKGWHGTAAR